MADPASPGGRGRSDVPSGRWRSGLLRTSGHQRGWHLHPQRHGRRFAGRVPKLRAAIQRHVAAGRTQTDAPLLHDDRPRPRLALIQKKTQGYGRPDRPGNCIHGQRRSRQSAAALLHSSQAGDADGKLCRTNVDGAGSRGRLCQQRRVPQARGSTAYQIRAHGNLHHRNRHATSVSRLSTT